MYTRLGVETGSETTTNLPSFEIVSTLPHKETLHGVEELETWTTEGLLAVTSTYMRAWALPRERRPPDRWLNIMGLGVGGTLTMAPIGVTPRVTENIVLEQPELFSPHPVVAAPAESVGG